MSITVASPTPISKDEEEDIPQITSLAVNVKKGDNLKHLLKRQNLPSKDIQQITKLAKANNLASLQVGQQVTFDYELKIIEDNDKDLATESRTLNKITIRLSKTERIEILRTEGEFVVKNTLAPLSKIIAKSSTVINANFISSLKALGISDNNIIDLINSYSYQIDFQRQIQPGDTITIITEKFVTPDGALSHYGKILYASLNLSGKNYNIYRYRNSKEEDYTFFSENGKSVKRSLLRTPLNIIRVSSHYGKRIHPTQGFTKMHKGVDFAAPVGTPIYAAGNGAITEIGWKSGYGKFIQIKHSPTLSTSYAHACSFAKNLQVGSHVKQGQVIAYVGATGRTTGAHLHYEVKIDGKNVNPMSIKTTATVEFSRKQFTKFKLFKDKIQTLLAQLDNDVELAEADFNIN